MNALPVPALSFDQMQQVEQLLAADYFLQPLQWMENAGRASATLARHLLDHEIEDRAVIVLAGRGTKGAFGMAAARHLFNWGADVQMLGAHPPDAYEGEVAHQFQSLQAAGMPMAWADEGWELPPCDLVIDAVIGSGLRGDPRGRSRDLIQLANSSMAPILSLVVPSGLDSVAGTAFSPCVQATATLAVGLPSAGLAAPESESWCGELFLADIGVPLSLYAELNLPVPSLFGASTLIALLREANQLYAGPPLPRLDGG